MCASDRCLWIDRATDDDGADAIGSVDRYDRLATAGGLAAASLTEQA